MTKETKSIIIIIFVLTSGVVETKSDTITLKTLNGLPEEEYLIENLKELFIVGDKEKLNIQEHELLRRLIGDNEIKNLSGLKSISWYPMRDKSHKEINGDDLYFQIWEFDNQYNAKWYFDVLKQVVYTKALYEKPPKLFFLVSNKLYYFAPRTYSRNMYMFWAKDKLINCCFSESEVHILPDSDIPYRR